MSQTQVFIEDDRPCNVCGRALTDEEKARIDLDIDFIEHHGHLIGRDPKGAARTVA